MKLKGKIINGKKVYNNGTRYIKELKRLDGKDFVEYLEEAKDSPTLNQYAYYYGGLLRTALESEVFGGWEQEELDAFLKEQFLTKIKMKTVKEDLITLRITKDKSAISKKEMVEYIEKCIMFMATEGIEIEDSETYLSQDANEKTKKILNENVSRHS